jgi:hypothetical protein
MNFRGMMKCVSGACCAAVVMICASGAWGMIMEKEAVHISEPQQFFQIDAEQAKSIKSVNFEGIEINSEFVSSFYSMMYHLIDNLCFRNCTLAKSCSFSDLFDSEYPVVSLEIINCGISIKDASAVLSLINPYLVKRIDFSGNNFENQRDLFEREILEKKISGVMCLDTLIWND